MIQAVDTRCQGGASSVYALNVRCLCLFLDILFGIDARSYLLAPALGFRFRDIVKEEPLAAGSLFHIYLSLGPTSQQQRKLSTFIKHPLTFLSSLPIHQEEPSQVASGQFGNEWIVLEDRSIRPLPKHSFRSKARRTAL